VASHDLQEPLRMVASYTQLLAKRYQGRLTPKPMFSSSMVDGATRMQTIKDLPLCLAWVRAVRSSPALTSRAVQ
jgi:light-regulated signal transduction histidine kinase (bacteriophytochrome)